MRTATVGLWALISSAVLASPAPTLDGFVNDPFWSEKGRVWTLYDPAQPETISRCYLGYDDQYLYFAADVTDTNVVGSNRTPKSKVWEDDAIKLLVHVGDRNAPAWTAETVSYTFSAMGGIHWCRGPLPADADPAVEPGWPSPWNSAVQWAVGLKPGTTPNVSGRPDKGYSVEARIPWSELGVRPPFAPGATLNIAIVNICRPELSMPQGKVIASVPAACAITPLEPRLWQRVRMDWYGPLPTRGLIEELPLWLGSPSPEYQAFKTSEADPAGLWWDRARWTARLELMRSQNMNTLVLRHTNPWTGLLAAAQAETRPAETVAELIGKTGWFKPDDFARCRDQFRWILSEAASRGIKTYLLLADDSLAGSKASPASASAPAEGTTSAALGEIARKLIETYPDLAGLGAGAGFNSPATLQAVADGLRAGSPASPPAGATTAAAPGVSARELLVWADGVSPADVAAVAQRYPELQILHSLQGAHWYKPLADERLRRFALEADQAARDVAPLRNVAVGSLRGAMSYMFWADPQWARTLMLDLRNQGLQGFLLEPGPNLHPIGREALFDYAYNMGQRFSRQRWESRVQVYGVGEYAGQLLETMQRASAIIPESLLLLYDASPQFMPQFGLLLTHYTALPSYSGPEGLPGPRDMRAESMSERNPAWPEPVWGRNVASIRSESDRTSSGEAIPAWQVAANISRHVDACNSLLPALRHIQPGSPEQAAELTTLLDAIELNVAMGDHIANKIKAALAWEQYKARRGRMIDCTQPLSKSVEAWRKVVELSDRIYPDAVPYWQSQPVSPPPWPADYLQRTYVPVTGKWADQMRRFDRELALIRAAVSGHEPVRSLPLWDHVNAAAEDKRQTRFVFDFENPDQRYRILLGASIQEGAETRLDGKKSLLIDTRNMPPGRHEVFVTEPGHVQIMSGQKYQVSLIYRVIDPGTGVEPFEVGVRPALGGDSLGDHRRWTAPAGHAGSRILQVPGPPQDGNVMYIAIHSPAAIVVDAVQIALVLE